MSGQKNIRQLILVGISGVVLIGGGGLLVQNYLHQQTLKSVVSQDDGAYDESEGDTDDLKTVTWQGETYRYNDHLSNFLFLGIDTRETVETETGNADAGQADAPVSGQLGPGGKSGESDLHSQRYYDTY